MIGMTAYPDQGRQWRQGCSQLLCNTEACNHRPAPSPPHAAHRACLPIPSHPGGVPMSKEAESMRPLHCTWTLPRRFSCTAFTAFPCLQASIFSSSSLPSCRRWMNAWPPLACPPAESVYVAHFHRSSDDEADSVPKRHLDPPTKPSKASISIGTSKRCKNRLRILSSYPSPHWLITIHPL